MKVVYICRDKEITIMNVVKISQQDKGLYIWQKGAAFEEYIFISYELSYCIILDSPMEIDYTKMQGKIECCESLIADIKDTIDDYKSTIKMKSIVSLEAKNLTQRIIELKSMKENLEELIEDYTFQLGNV